MNHTACCGTEGTSNWQESELLARDNSTFAVAIYQKLCETGGGTAQNLFFSPYSISTAFAMTYAGARGNTEQEMAQTLSFSLDQSRLHPAFAQVAASLKKAQDSGSVTLNLANSLWPHKEYALLGDYLALLEHYYGVTITTPD
jgi:serpin B